MRRREMSQWDKDAMAHLIFTGEAFRIDVREIGQGVATHQFMNPRDQSKEDVYCAIVAFFSLLGDKVGSAYVLLE